MKLPLEDLNPDSCPLHPTIIYSYGVTTTPRVRSGGYRILFKSKESMPN